MAFFRLVTAEDRGAEKTFGLAAPKKVLLKPEGNNGAVLLEMGRESAAYCPNSYIYTANYRCTSLLAPAMPEAS